MQQSAYDLWKEYSLGLMDGHCFTLVELDAAMNAVLDRYRSCTLINGLMHGKYTLAEKIDAVKQGLDSDTREDIVMLLGVDESRWCRRAQEVQELIQHRDVQSHWVQDIEGICDCTHHYNPEYY